MYEEKHNQDRSVRHGWPRWRVRISPIAALALVLLTLMLLVVVPMAIGTVVAARERALYGEFQHVHRNADAIRHLLNDERNALNLFVISLAEPDYQRFVSAARKVPVGFGRLRESAAGFDPSIESRARSAHENWQRWTERHGLDRLVVMDGQPEQIRAAIHESNQAHQRVKDEMDELVGRIEDGRAAVPSRFRLMRAVQNTITVLLGFLSLFAGFVVYRTQGFIQTNLAELDSERKKLLAVYNGVDVGIALWEPRQKRLSINPSGREILGIDEEEPGRQRFLDDLFPRGTNGEPITREQWPLESAASGKQFEDCEIMVTTGDGRDLRILFSGAPVITNHRGKVELAVTVFRDVTAQREAERQLRSLAVVNARRAQEMGAIFNVARDLSVEGGTDRLHSFLTEQVAKLFDAEKCVIWLCTPDGAELRPEPPAFGFRPEALRTVAIPLAPDSAAHLVMANDQPAINEADGAGADLGAGSKCREALGLETILAVRLSASGQHLGILAVYNKKDGSRFTEEDARLLRAFAGQAAFALHSSVLYEEANRRADLLTWAMKETHHRIKNNLQAVSAILDVQAMDAREYVPAETLHDVLRQIRSIAVVHDLLSKNLEGTNEGSISADVAFEQLVPVLTMGRADKRVGISLNVADVLLPSKLATSLALIVNELVSNALKHGSRNTDQVNVTVTLEPAEDHIRLIVEDNGPGFPPGFDQQKHTGIGLDLVRMLVERDLSGKLKYTNAPGARVEATLPLPGAS